ncbi:hypothetical protein CSHISOI_11686 [Colletotrichum shisoi]|uniref:Uncharacterized protein n=1 Tax=Colletotrichum shisoi TaxID=2078593 RepID=A0A5Q4B9Y4_9PEZI|nr:hypothetical protein CSHISOI_11686 [Colletotrichum shisoi]
MDPEVEIRTIELAFGWPLLLLAMRICLSTRPPSRTPRPRNPVNSATDRARRALEAIGTGASELEADSVGWGRYELNITPGSKPSAAHQSVKHMCCGFLIRV